MALPWLSYIFMSRVDEEDRALRRPEGFGFVPPEARAEVAHGSADCRGLRSVEDRARRRRRRR